MPFVAIVLTFGCPPVKKHVVTAYKEWGWTFLANAKVREALRHPDKPGAGAAKRKDLSVNDHFDAIMAEFKRGTLRSGDTAHVRRRAQALAIAFSESGKKKKGSK